MNEAESVEVVRKLRNDRLYDHAVVITGTSISQEQLELTTRLTDHSVVELSFWVFQ